MPDEHMPPHPPDGPLALILAAQRLPLPGLEDRAPDDAAAPDGADAEGWTLEQRGDVLAGRLRAKARTDLATQTLEIYRRIFDATDGWNLARVWNIVPAINAVAKGTENYRAFNEGRARAFAERFGAEAESRMCAASCVGGESGLDIAFIAVRGPVVHLENPEQTPAYRYPARYGPKSPSFARATVCTAGGKRIAFVSGTAAVKNHASVTDDLARQCATTADNLGIMERALVENGIAPDAPRLVNVFIRRPEDAPFIRDRLTHDWLRPGDTVRLHRADICRAELALEIEFAVIGERPSQDTPGANSSPDAR